MEHNCLLKIMQSAHTMWYAQCLHDTLACVFILLIIIWEFRLLSV